MTSSATATTADDHGRSRQSRRWPWISIAAGGGLLGAMALLRRIRRARAARVKMGYVSEDWVAQHRADREERFD